MDPIAVRAKFGDDYAASEQTFRLGINIRLARRIAERYRGRTVIEPVQARASQRSHWQK